MKALVPSSPSAVWSVTATGATDGGELDEVSITVESDAESAVRRGRSTLLTAARIGARLTPGGGVNGRIDDWSARAAHAITSFLLGEIPIGMGREESFKAMEAANVQANALAADREAWAVTPLNLTGVDYALWRRNVPGGVVAHTDLGWATIEMWGTDQLPAGPFHLVDGPFQVDEIPA